MAKKLSIFELHLQPNNITVKVRKYGSKYSRLRAFQSIDVMMNTLIATLEAGPGQTAASNMHSASDGQINPFRCMASQITLLDQRILIVMLRLYLVWRLPFYKQMTPLTFYIYFL